jgi:hypothetical protein
MENYKKNLELLTKNHVYSKEMEHDACGVGLIASTEGKKSRAIVEYGIEALKQFGIGELLMQMAKQEMELEYMLKFQKIFL